MPAKTEANDLFNRKSIRRALKDIGNSKKLGTHPLASLNIVSQRRQEKFGDTPAGHGIVLRQILREVIGNLKPSGDKPDFADRNWRYYFILREQYIVDRRANEIRDDLGISESGYFNDQRHALDRLAEALQELEQRVFPANPVASPVQPISPQPLPQPTTPFIGRVSEQKQLTELLCRQDVRLITLVGTGGIGKTRLSLQIALKNQALFPQGVYFVPLAPLGSVDYLIPSIANIIGLNFDDQEEAREQLLHFLRPQSLLLVMDNFEHLLDSTALVQEMLEQAPHIKIVATSRERLQLRGEYVFALQGLEMPATIQGNDPHQFSAGQLFLQAAERQGVSIQATDYDCVTRICQLVGGMPLALELAASWVHVLPCHEMAAEIERSLDILAGEFRDLPARHQSLRAVFEHSWALLSEKEQMIFRQLSVFPGGFSRAAAAAIAGATLPILHSFNSKSLVKTTPDGRFAVQELLRQFAGEKLAEMPAEWASTHFRFAQYFIQLLQKQKNHLKFGEQQSVALQTLENDLGNIRLAWAWSVEQGIDSLVLSGLEPIYLMMARRRRYQDGVETFGRLGEAWHDSGQLSPEKQRALALALCLQANFLFKLGEEKKARGLLTQGLQMLQPVSLPADWAFAGILAIGLNLDVPDLTAARLFGDSRAIFQALEDDWGVATLSYEMSTHLYAIAPDKHAQAQELVEQSLQLRQKIGDQWGLVNSLHYLGHIAYVQGRYSEAEQHTLDSLDIAVAIGDRLGEANAYNNLGQVLATRGEYEDAIAYYSKCLAIRREFGNPRRVAECLAALGYVIYLSDDIEGATAIYEESWALAQETNNEYGVAWALHNLGDIARVKGELAAAQKLYIESHERHLARDPLDWGRLVSLGKLGQVTLDLEDWENAGIFLTQAFEMAMHIERYREATDALLGLAKWAFHTDQLAKAAVWVTVVQNHHATVKETQDKAMAQQAEVQAYLPPHVYHLAETEGKKTTLEDIRTALKC